MSNEHFEVTPTDSHKEELRKALGELQEEGLIRDFGLVEEKPTDELPGDPDNV